MRQSIQKNWFVFIVVLWFFNGCMESKENLIEKEEEPTPQETPTVLQGQLIDSQVSGVGYRTTSDREGLTDQHGTFEYIAGDEIEFKIGELNLGKTKAQAVITPIELANRNTINFPEVINRLRLLQSLDNDQNPANGILITESTRRSASAINFDQEQALFENDARTLLQQVCNSCPLVKVSEAVAHFQRRFNNAQDSLATGTFKSPTPVIGLGYRLSSGYLGQTDSEGKFLYQASQPIRFFIDEINLGEVTAKEEMTVLDLAATTNLIESKVINRQTLLVVLDNDNDLSNGIDVSQVSSDVRLVDGDYDINPQGFVNDAVVQQILSDRTVPIPAEIISDLKTGFEASQTSHQYNPLGTIESIFDFAHTGFVSSSHQILAKGENIYALSQATQNRAILRVGDEIGFLAEQEIATTDAAIHITMALEDQFYFVMADTTNALSIKTCELDDARLPQNCTDPQKLSIAQTSESTINLSFQTNDSGQVTKTYTVFSHSVNGLFLSECNQPDDGNCTTTNLSVAEPTRAKSVTFFNEDNDYVYVATESQTGKLALAYCTIASLTPTTCQASTLSANDNQGLTPSIALKSGEVDYVWVASIDQTKGGQPQLTRCTRRTDQTVFFASCENFDLLDKIENQTLRQVLKQVEMASPDLYIRNDNELLVLTQSRQAPTRSNLFRCSFNANDEPTNCRWFDLSQDQANTLPRLAENGGKLYWIARDASAEYISKVFKMSVEF